MTRLTGILFVAACSSTASGPPQPYVAAVGKGSGTPVDQIVVTVNELRSNDGTVRCFLYDDGTDFPDSSAHVISRAVGLPAAKAASCMFSSVGREHDYAIVILHDENNDNIFQKNALGMPREGYGFSNNARARFSAPSFDDCKFHFASGTVAMTIATQY